MTDQIYLDSMGNYILIAILLLLILLIIYIYNKIKDEGERKQLCRRKSKRPVRERQAPEDCSAHCLKAVYYETSIRELQQEIEHWQQAYRSMENKCALMQDTITKLRIRSK